MLGRYRERIRAWTDPVGRGLFRLRLRPNHLTVIGLGVSFLAASAFSAGRTRAAGLLLIVAGLCDFFDGALARVSGQVTPFGAFLDSVIDRYSDLLVLLGIVVLFARMPHTRGAIVAMAGLIGSMMVSYTKARAESIGVRCTVGRMERPERMICLIAGALLGLLAPAQAQGDDFDGARATAASVAERYRESRLAPRALLLATTFASRAGDEAQAQTLLGRLVKGYPDAPELPEALYLLGMSAEARGQRELAARTYRELRLLLPASDYADGAADRLPALEAPAAGARGGDAEASEALYRGAEILDALDRREEAATAYRAVVARYPSREVGAKARWRLGWLAWLAGDARGAAEEWTRLTGRGVDSAYRIVALYWAGRARAAQGDGEVAERLLTQVLAEVPRSYYGVLAATRLPGRPVPGVKARVTLPDEPSQAVAADPGFARVELVRRIGLLEEAIGELEELAERATGDPVRLYGISGAYVKEERYHLALRILRRALAPLAATGDPALPQAFWETLYPLGWRAELMAAAQSAGLDPYLVAAVVREESSYYPRALSPVGARGLMQLMPDTMAPPKGARADHLDDPAQNLRLGTRFLAALLREFGDPRFGDPLIGLLPAGPGEPSGGLDHVCLSIRCEDLEDVARALAQKGVALEGGIVQRYGAYGNGPSLYLSDPDGYKIELKPRI